jgi:hypothetical protein
MFAAINHIFSNKEKTTMRSKTNVRAGGTQQQHNQTVARSLKVKTNVKAGRITANHNQTVAQGSKVKSDIKAGLIIVGG